MPNKYINSQVSPESYVSTEKKSKKKVSKPTKKNFYGISNMKVKR